MFRYFSGGLEFYQNTPEIFSFRRTKLELACDHAFKKKPGALNLKKKKKICNSDDTELHYFPIEKHVKYGFHPAKCLSNSSGGLGTMSFSGITQQLKARLKANVLLCFPKPGFKCHSQKHSVV